jgi:hypothetical protein
VQSPLGEEEYKMKRLLRLLVVLCPLLAVGQTATKIQIGSIVIGNRYQGVTSIFIHLDYPGIQPTMIDDVVIDVNGRKQHSKPSVGTIFTPTELLVQAADLPGYLPPPPFDVVTVQIRFLPLPDNKPISIALADGSTVEVYGMQTTGMVPCRGAKHLKLGTTDTKGQSVPIYLHVVPTRE